MTPQITELPAKGRTFLHLHFVVILIFLVKICMKCKKQTICIDKKTYSGNE